MPLQISFDVRLLAPHLFQLRLQRIIPRTQLSGAGKAATGLDNLVQLQRPARTILELDFQAVVIGTGFLKLRFQRTCPTNSVFPFVVQSLGPACDVMLLGIQILAFGIEHRSRCIRQQ